jgi:hypothetical protein
MPTTKAQSPAPHFPPFTDMGARTLDAMSALGEAGQRVGSQMIELWASAATDRLRTLGEIQSATVDATRSALAPVDPRQALEELRQDPVLWYQRSLLSVLDGTQRVWKLVETNAQIVSRSAERFQSSTERTSKEIDSAVSSCASRLRELYSARS